MIPSLIYVENLLVGKKTNNSNCCVLSLQIFHAHFQLTVNYRPIILPQRSENELQHGNEGREIFLPAVDRSAGARFDSRTTFAVSCGRAGADRRAELSAEAVNAAGLNYSVTSPLFNLPPCRATFTSLAPLSCHHFAQELFRISKENCDFQVTAGPSENDRGSSGGDSGGNSPSPFGQGKATPKKTSESTSSGHVVVLSRIRSYGIIMLHDE